MVILDLMPIIIIIIMKIIYIAPNPLKTNTKITIHQIDLIEHSHKP